MKTGFKSILFLLIQLLPLFLLAQSESHPPEPDDGMNLFLLVFGSVFIGAIFGAAVIGAFLAALVALIFIGLFSFGLLSASFAIGLYKRSLSAGFKSMLFLFFGFTCSFFGWAGVAVLTRLFSLHLSPLEVSLTGLLAGLAGGLLLAFITLRIIKELGKWIMKKLSLE